ncbi:cation:proton antiporter [Pararhizobium sp. BT-229]|uniref:cation:proton antiporter n=1 Tax=Pararhizobium sp. BT-229 TaxID=2986923 RepID=UPI0021F6EDCD|nr:cation:proton antiporter [Pararhizobium sp. BT-229]MCV9963429.1 cation:proton antiporter [Pararhizobium sp. BT-229]
MSASTILTFSTTFALVVLSLGLLLTVARIVRGPTLPDRVLGLDMLVAIAVGFIAVIAIRSGFNLYIDIAIALSLVGFLATVAFARFILARGLSPEADEAPRQASRQSEPLPKRVRQAKAAQRKNRGGRR